MPTTALVRLYDTLTPWERLPLLLAAAFRADALEVDRLARSSPASAFRIPDHWSLVTGLESLAKLYLLRQLDGASTVWRLVGAVESGGTDIEQQRDERLWKLIRLEAYRITVRAAGWQQFATDLRVDALGILTALPGHEAAQQAEEFARSVAYTAAEAATFVQELGRQDPAAGALEIRMETAADVAVALRRALEQHQEAWS